MNIFLLQSEHFGKIKETEELKLVVASITELGEFEIQFNQPIVVPDGITKYSLQSDVFDKGLKRALDIKIDLTTFMTFEIIAG